MTTSERGRREAPEEIRIEIWSDIACPWCYIGKRRLEQALEGLGDDVPPVVRTYRSFELSPDTPVDVAGSTADYLAHHKGLPHEQVEAMLAQVTGVAASVGLTYDMPSVKQTRTLLAHRLLHLARERGLQLELVERLFRAHFTEGRHVGRVADLADLAADVGLDREAVVVALESDAYAEEVAADIAQARDYGITGVPFAVIDGRYGVSGAQPAEVFASAIAQARQDRASAERHATVGEPA